VKRKLHNIAEFHIIFVR